MLHFDNTATVARLREILATLPDNMPVVVGMSETVSSVTVRFTDDGTQVASIDTEDARDDWGT